MTTIEFDDDIYLVPYSQLRVSDKNVRKKRDQKELQIPQLAAQIKAETLLQNLVTTFGEGGKFVVERGKKTPKGPLEILDGYRRYLAVGLNTSELLLDLDPMVPVRIRPPDHAISASLTAAFGQLPLHPVEQFDAFKALVDEGKSVVDIAAAFGLEEKAVSQRLQLAKVAPPILQAFREDELSLDLLQAYTVTDDQERQLAVFKSRLHGYTDAQKASEIRKHLTEKDIPDTDLRVVLVGRDAYEKAGGTVRADLFGSTTYFSDAALLQQLVDARTAELEKRVRAEGWSWVEVKLTGYQSWNYQARKAKIDPTTPAQDGELAGIAKQQGKIGKELQRIRSLPETADEDVESGIQANVNTLEVEHAALTSRRKEIEAERTTWGKKTLAEAGAVITIGASGELVVHRGLVDPKTAKRLEKAKQKAAAEKSGRKDAETISTTLHQNLTAHRSAVIRDRLRGDHRTALAVLLHGILPDSIGHDVGMHRHNRAALCGTEGIATTEEHESAGVDPQVFVPYMNTSVAIEDCCLELPTDNLDLLGWLLDQDMPKLLELMALSASGSFDAIYGNNGDHAANKAALTDALVEHLDIDMREHWQATGESYFKHVSKELIVEAVTEAKGAIAGKALGAMSKADAAEAAEIHLDSEEWLPALFRRPERAKEATPSAKKLAARKVVGKTAKVAKAAKGIASAQGVTQEEAVAHIQGLLDAKRQREAEPSSWPSTPDAAPIADKARPKLKAPDATKVTGKKAPAKKVAVKKASVKKMRKP